MRIPALFTALALSALATTTLHAETFNFSFGSASDPIKGSGVLTGNLTSPGEYIITSIQGTTYYPGSADLTIEGLLAEGAFEENDNVLSLTSDGYTFDMNGLSYQLSDSTFVNLYGDPSQGAGEVFQTSSYTIGSEYTPDVIAATPEPNSLALLGTGLFCVLGIAQRRFRA